MKVPVVLPTVVVVVEIWSFERIPEVSGELLATAGGRDRNRCFIHRLLFVRLLCSGLLSEMKSSQQDKVRIQIGKFVRVDRNQVLALGNGESERWMIVYVVLIWRALIFICLGLPGRKGREFDEEGEWWRGWRQLALVDGLESMENEDETAVVSDKLTRVISERLWAMKSW